MLGAARGDAVGKLGESGAAAQMHVLDLDIGAAARIVLEQQIDAARRAVFLLGPHGRVAGERRDGPGGDRFSYDPVRKTGVDADQCRAAPHVVLDHLPRVAILACGAVALRKPYDGAGPRQAEHRACVGTAGGDLRAVVERDVGKEALVAAQQATALQGSWESHAREVRSSTRPAASGADQRGS